MAKKKTTKKEKFEENLKVNKDSEFPYKYSKTCVSCGKRYGIDRRDAEKRPLCPNCMFPRKRVL